MSEYIWYFVIFLVSYFIGYMACHFRNMSNPVGYFEITSVEEDGGIEDYIRIQIVEPIDDAEEITLQRKKSHG